MEELIKPKGGIFIFVHINEDGSKETRTKLIDGRFQQAFNTFIEGKGPFMQQEEIDAFIDGLKLSDKQN